MEMQVTHHHDRSWSGQQWMVIETPATANSLYRAIAGGRRFTNNPSDAWAAFLEQYGETRKFWKAARHRAMRLQIYVEPAE